MNTVFGECHLLPWS